MSTELQPEVGGHLWHQGKAYVITSVSKTRIKAKSHNDEAAFVWPSLKLVGGIYGVLQHSGWARLVTPEQLQELKSKAGAAKEVERAAHRLYRAIESNFGAAPGWRLVKEAVEQRGIEAADRLVEQINAFTSSPTPNE